MTDQTRPAALDDLLAHVIGAIDADDPLPPHGSIALDVLTDALIEGDAPSPASAFTAAKYLLARHARELAELFVAQRVPERVDPRYWAANQLQEYATQLDGQTTHPAP